MLLSIMHKVVTITSIKVIHFLPLKALRLSLGRCTNKADFRARVGEMREMKFEKAMEFHYTFMCIYGKVKT